MYSGTRTMAFEKFVESPLIGQNEVLHIELNKAKDRFVLTFNNVYTYKTADGIEVSKPSTPSTICRRFISRFPEKKNLHCAYPTERISVPAVDIPVLILLSWPKGQLSTNSETAAKIRELKAVYNKQVVAAAVVADYHNDKFKGTDGAFTLHPQYPLAAHQSVALQCSSIVGNYALFMEQGTGKTASVIARICNEAAKSDKMYRAIVVCPKGVRYNWKAEVEKFATCKGSVHIVSGSKMKRGNTIVSSFMNKEEGDKFSLLVLNYESVESCMEFFTVAKAVLMTTEGFDKETDKLFDLAVLDESHFIKTPSAVRSKAAHKLRDEAKNRMVLTGTPITNNPFDLFMQFEFLDKGQSGFGSYTAFKDFFGVFDVGGGGFEKLVGLQNIPLLKDRLARTSFIVKKEEALPDLPEKVYDYYDVEMTGEQIDMYKQIATQILAEIEMESAGDKVSKNIEAQHILTKMLRLAQVTSGYVGFTEKRNEETGEIVQPKSEFRFKKNPKLDALVEILKSKNENQKTVVWCCFIPDIEAISERLAAEGIDHVTYYGATSDKNREIAKERFNNDPKCKVIVGNPDTAGTGLNLLGYCPERPDEYETNCDHEIFYSQNWKPDPRWQAEDRCHRRGTRTNVRVTDLIVPNTIDTEIRNRVKAKRDMAEDVADVSTMLEDLRQSLETLAL